MLVKGCAMKRQSVSLAKSPWKGLLLTGSVLAILAACGDDSGSGADNSREKVEVVSSIYNLGDCTEDMEGDTVFVKDKKVDYVCQNQNWMPVEDDESQGSSSNKNDKESSSSGAKDKSCSSVDEQSSSSSSVEADAISSKKEELSSSSVTADSLSSSSSVAKDTTDNNENDIVIKDKSISGVSQKGPFVNGSSVTVQELDGKTLAQTGKSFMGKISNDKGEFSISSVSLASQYAILEATGYYRNEISGNKSKGTMTLNALTDLKDRKKVNINLLTHLEYERALYLIGTGLSVDKAKKQAESEIFKAFSIEGDFVNSEDLDIFSDGDENAALLAISVLMLSDRNEADLTELLTNFATDIEKDGKWDDDVTKTKIADWASDTDLSGRLATIRSYIQGWNLGNVPGFEKYVRNFWYKNYGLDDCSDNREGEILATKNEKSTTYNTQERFICKSGVWVIASDIEKDTYQWNTPSKYSTAKDGDAHRGDVEEINCYVFENNAWRSGIESDCSLGLRGCTAIRQDTVGKGNDGVWYICDATGWRLANDIEADTAMWGLSYRDGDAKYGNVNANLCYVYENNVWRNGNESDCTLDIRGCTALRQGSVEKGSDNEFYYCNDKTWRIATILEKDTYQQTCSEFGQIIYGNVVQDNLYFCDGKKWKKFYGNAAKTYEKLEDSRDGQVYRAIKIGTQTWMAENLNYADSVNYPSMLGKSWCYNNESDSCEIYGRLYTWAAAIDSVSIYLKSGLDCGYNKTCGLNGPIQGICPEGWHLPSFADYKKLFSYIGDTEYSYCYGCFETTSGPKIKSQYLYEENGEGSDDYGFSALPAGGFASDAGADAIYRRRFYGQGKYASFLTSDEDGLTDIIYMYASYNTENANVVNWLRKPDGISVRCVRDNQ